VIADHLPLLNEPDRRYWRRSANRQVRKARLLRVVMRGSLVALAHGLVAGVVLYAGARAVRELRASPGFATSRIEIEGAVRASEDSIRARLADYLRANLLDLDLEQLAARAAQDPWVERASAKRLLPDTVRVTIVEREPSAIAVIRGVPHVVDRTGHVLGPCGPGLDYDLPALAGLALDGPELVAALRRGVGLVERLRQARGDWLAQVSELDLAQDDRVVVRTERPGPAILLDPERVERNLDAWLATRSQIERRAGPAAVVDLRWQDRISVTPARETITEGS
jgi:cell division septal protein FtsQ